MRLLGEEGDARCSLATLQRTDIDRWWPFAREANVKVECAAALQMKHQFLPEDPR
jgi:hypothetical protein